MSAAGGLDGNGTQTEWTLTGGSRPGFFWLVPLHQGVHRFHNEEKYHQCKYQEADNCIDELANEEVAVVDGKCKVREAKATENTDKRGNEIFDQGINNTTEGSTYNDTNRQVYNIAAKYKCLKLVEDAHRLFPYFRYS